MSVCNSAALVESEIAMESIDILDRTMNEICCSRPTNVAHRALTKVWWPPLQCSGILNSLALSPNGSRVSLKLTYPCG